MSERIDAVEEIAFVLRSWLPAEYDEERATKAVLARVKERAGLSGDGKVVLDFTGDNVTVEGRLEDAECCDGLFYRIVEPS